MKIFTLLLGFLYAALGLSGSAMAVTSMENTEAQSRSAQEHDSNVMKPTAESVEPSENDVVAITAQPNSQNLLAEKRCWPQASEDKKAKKASFVQSMIKITSSSPKGAFASGESAFQLVVLPKFNKEYRLEFSLVFDHNFRKQSELLVPSVAVVDENFCEISDFLELEFTPTYGVFAAVHVEKAFIVIDNEKPKYAIIYTNARFNNSEVNVTTDFGYGMNNSERFS